MPDDMLVPDSCITAFAPVPLTWFCGYVFDRYESPASADAIFASPVREYRARAKEALRLMGVLENAVVRPPLLPLEESERQRVREALERAGALASVASRRGE